MPLFLPRWVLCLICLPIVACSRAPSPPMPAGAPGALQIIELKPGTGAAISVGQKAVVNYTGWLYESGAPDNKGKKFDSSLDAGMPFSFGVGAQQVIKGWDQGVVGMKIGARRRLIIPPDLAYGDIGAGGLIPGGATLVFDVELLGIE
jgi:FKBP-type peptidyl-prolyl cis-trans isomerase FkpA